MLMNYHTITLEPMMTSRIARKPAKIAPNVTNADYVPRRQTRAFAVSYDVKQEAGSATESLESSNSPPNGLDIEDVSFGTTSSRKRKIDTDSLPIGKILRSYAYPITPIPADRANIKSEDIPNDIKSKDIPNGIQSKDIPNGKVKKARRQPAKRIVGDNGQTKLEPPTNWEEIYDAVKEMRKERLAPVDTMGCETLAEDHMSPRDKRFQTLIALMLSSQTKDITNAIAMRRLQTELPSPGLTLENILAVEPEKLNELIYVVGFHNNKTRYIKAAALVLKAQFNGDIPDTVEGLMSLPGVGPKMAYLCLSAAWGRTEGIGVDVHVHRITNLWGWHKTKSPEETRMMLEAWLPREKWHEINLLLVGFGQTVCLPVGRRCGECLLAEQKLCPSAVVEKKGSVKRAKREVAKGNGG
ncbi:MAG: hypothetical protein Q9163_001120 [Psora crenata]